jgi:acyl dehydratase
MEDVRAHVDMGYDSVVVHIDKSAAGRRRAVHGYMTAAGTQYLPQVRSTTSQPLTDVVLGTLGKGSAGGLSIGTSLV